MGRTDPRAWPSSDSADGHLPPSDVHPSAALVAEAAEAAGAQGAFWELHGPLFQRQDALRLADLIASGLARSRAQRAGRMAESRAELAQDRA